MARVDGGFKNHPSVEFDENKPEAHCLVCEARAKSLADLPEKCQPAPRRGPGFGTTGSAHSEYMS